MAGIDAVHVPYKGGAPALADLVAGQLAFMIENVPGTLPLVKDGKLRALAITSRKRSPLVPDLPTMDEAGVPGYEMVGWNGVFVPKGTPSRDRRQAARRARRCAALAGRCRNRWRGSAPRRSAIARRHSPLSSKSKSLRWGAIIREKGIKPE